MWSRVQGMTDGDEDEPESVLEGMGALWIPVFVAALGMALVILLSLWVAGWRVEQGIVAQVEGRWQVGESLALRVLHIDGARQPLLGSRIRAHVIQGALDLPLGEITDPAEIGVAQGRFVVPELAVGPAVLVFEVEGADLPALREAVAIEVVDERPPQRGDLTISTSNLNWGDNTQPQPEGVMIVVRSERRLLAGFDNTLMIRISDPDGYAIEAEIEVALIGGEFMGRRGKTREPPILAHERSDRLGLVMLHGPLTSEIIELEVRVVEPGLVFTEEGRKIAKRRFRMVSFAGAVRLEADPLVLSVGDPASIAVRGLRSKRPIYVDIHGPDGAWVDSLEPVIGRQPPRRWLTTGIDPGLVQAEAYYFTNKPGESAEVLRLQVVDGDPTAPESLDPVLERYREELAVPRVERAFDREAEASYLAQLERSELDPGERDRARRFLLGTLPVQVLGPPRALSTLSTRVEAMVERKKAWYLGLRVALLGGGGLFLLILALMILRRHAGTARAIAEVLGDGESADDPEIDQAIAAAKRSAWVRMWAVLVVMGLGLWLVEAALDRIVWRV